MKPNKLRSLLVGAGIEAGLVALIQSAVVSLSVRPLPLHPLALLGLLTQVPGVLLIIPFILLESSISEQVVGTLEVVEVCVVTLVQSLFFGVLHYNYAKRGSNIEEQGG